MPAFIDENQQFIDPDTSAPIVNGNVFFGERGADPEGVPIVVFAERGLITPIDQPIKTNASGRTTQKIWLPARYSFRVRNSAGTQKLIDLDAGATEIAGIAVLTNITGSNTITAQADPTITALTGGQQFSFVAVSINTDKMTLKINETDPKPIKFNFNEEVGPGFVQANQTVNVTFNSVADQYDLNNDGRGVSLLTNVAGDGNTITADGGPSVAGYVDKQLYSFKQNITNTGNATLKVGTLPTVPIKAKGSEIAQGGLLVNNIIVVAFNSTLSVFELINASVNASNLITGLNCSNNVTDPDHDTDIAVGKARDFGAVFTMELSSIITKRIDAAWSVGNNQGGLDTGTVASATGYGIYLIGRSDAGNVDAILSLDMTPDGATLTLPANYDQFRLIGFVTTDGSANIVKFQQVGDIFTVNNTDINIIDTTPSGSNIVAMELPPSSLVFFYVQQALINSDDTIQWDIFNPTETFSSVFTTSLRNFSATILGLSIPILILLDSSSQIVYRNVIPVAGVTFTIEPRICNMLTRSNPR